MNNDNDIMPEWSTGASTTLPTLKSVLLRAERFVDEISKWRPTEDIEADSLPFNTVDYYTMDTLKEDLRHCLTILVKKVHADE